ncbi:N-acetylglucosamine kinase [Aurantibacter sp.]|uniref:N-acetylglucosamine kinase n=1 Tax=Aurantibacter sp. TaxID=2807103 RepID=UPI0035C7BB8B
MILIVDSGSTKSDWIAIDNDGNKLFDKIKTKGLNPAILSEKKIKKIIKNEKKLKANRKKVTHLYFYGAGCGTETPRLTLKTVFKQFFSKAKVIIKEDTMAAVYATINTPKEAAIVCILGTGSNCSYFDGKVLHQRVSSLGYSIMDDGSGNYFGKQLLREYYFNHMPKPVRDSFEENYNLDADYIKYNLYKKPNPNAYLAQFAEFMILNKESKYIKELIKTGIRSFAKNMILQYTDELKTVPVHFAGSVAFFCQEEIREVAKELGFKTDNFIRRPIDGLVSFHKVNK